MIETQKIYKDIEILPEEAKSLLFDFVQLLKKRYINSEANINSTKSESIIDKSETNEIDPLIGLFSGEAELATQSEDILQQEITLKSGWTWKK